MDKLEQAQSHTRTKTEQIVTTPGRGDSNHTSLAGLAMSEKAGTDMIAVVCLFFNGERRARMRLCSREDEDEDGRWRRRRMSKRMGPHGR
jgi:hypothetical protein